MRRASRVDSNQPAIVDGLRAIGADVFHTHQLGKGYPDILCYFRGTLTWLEVKTATGTLTKDERDWHAAHPGAAKIVRSLVEAYAAIGAEVEG